MTGTLRYGLTSRRPLVSTKVTLDGEDVTMQCNEAIEGEDGLVVLFEDPQSLCPCRNLRQVVKRGNVKVYLKEAVPA